MSGPIASSSVETYDTNGALIGGSHTTQTGTILSGQNLAELTVIGRVTASDKLIAHDPAAVDGSEVAMGILACAIDASAGDVDGPYYSGGQFAIDLVVFDAALTTDDLKKQIFDGTPIDVKTVTAV